MSSRLTSLAVYHRRVGASLERVWENVRDWEHLPWLHGGSFRSIECLDAGDWGWRARVGLPPADVGPEIEIELRIDGSADRYVTRTLRGPARGTEIWTRLTAVDADATDIEVEFLAPGIAPDAREALGRIYVELYTRLWDEDESMMQRRAELLRRRPAPGPTPDLVLGQEAGLRASLPLRVEFAGRRYRVVDCGGELIAYDEVCPHMLGPLGEEPENGSLVCPWHGYRFDLKSGRCTRPERSGLRLRPSPRVRIDETGAVRLVSPAGAA